jgi:hypothetical protein
VPKKLSLFTDSLVLLLLQAVLPSDFPLVSNHEVVLPTLCSPWVDGKAFSLKCYPLGNFQRCNNFKLWLSGGKDLIFQPENQVLSSPGGGRRDSSPR